VNAEEKFGRLDPTELMGTIIGYAPNRRIDLQVAFRDRILALVRPAPSALDLATVRRILTARAPADPKWVEWVDGCIEEIAKATPSAGVTLTAEDLMSAAVIVRSRADEMANAIGDTSDSDRLYGIAEMLREAAS